MFAIFRITIIGVVLLSTSVAAAAGVTLAAVAGVHCDKPAVRDGSGFPSACAPRPMAGGAIGWAAHSRWRVDLEAIFAPRRFTSQAFVSNDAVRVDVLETAVIAGWRLRPAPAGWDLTIRGGPQVGSRLRARRRFRDVDEDITDQLREADLKLLVALRMSKRIGGASLLLEGRVGWGLTDLDNTNQQQIRSRAVGMLVGYAR